MWLRSRWTAWLGWALDFAGLPGMFGDGELWWKLVSFTWESQLALVLVSVGTTLLVGNWISKAAYNITMGHTVSFSPWLMVPRRPQIRAFDMPILAAVEHLLNTTAHSYTHLDRAERKAMENLHNAMCSGRLLVVGTENEFSSPKRISAWTCRQLVPIESVIPRSPAAPQGFTFILSPPIDNVPDEPVPVEESGAFRNLRVRSSDLYAIWPKYEK